MALDALHPSYYSGRYAPPVALLQLCVGRRCLVFQILHADYIPGSLFDFLADERFTFVGVGIGDDAAKLRAGYGLEVGCAEDLRGLAADTLENPALRSAGLAALVWEVMGHRRRVRLLRGRPEALRRRLLGYYSYLLFLKKATTPT